MTEQTTETAAETKPAKAPKAPKDDPRGDLRVTRKTIKGVETITKFWVRG